MLPNRDIDVDSGLEDYGLSEDELDDQSMEDVSGPLETDIEEDVGYAGSVSSLLQLFSKSRIGRSRLTHLPFAQVHEIAFRTGGPSCS
jgi:hypothetical protein